jgi:hypothetical protein
MPRLSKAALRAGIDAPSRLSGDQERGLELAERFGRLPDQKIPLPQEIVADHPLDVAPSLLGCPQTGAK